MIKTKVPKIKLETGSKACLLPTACDKDGDTEDKTCLLPTDAVMTKMLKVKPEQKIKLRRKIKLETENKA